MNDFVIEMNDVHKSYKRTKALAGFDLQVPTGSIYGFLGPNGAGKTTAIKLLMGMLKANGGEARVFGLNTSDPTGSVEARKRVGFVAEEKELYPYMTVEQIIRFTRPFYPGWREDLEKRYLKLFDLPANRKIPKLSKGMRSKLMLLLAMARGADLLILDEPMEGLDPAANEDVLRELVELSAAEGTTIFFSSHQIADVEQISDHICIIDQGTSRVSGALDDMKANYRKVQITFPDSPPPSVQWLEGATRIRQEGRMVSMLAFKNVDAILAQGRSFPGALAESFPLNLKEIFLSYIRSC